MVHEVVVTWPPCQELLKDIFMDPQPPRRHCLCQGHGGRTSTALSPKTSSEPERLEDPCSLPVPVAGGHRLTFLPGEPFLPASFKGTAADMSVACSGPTLRPSHLCAPKAQACSLGSPTLPSPSLLRLRPSHLLTLSPQLEPPHFSPRMISDHLTMDCPQDTPPPPVTTLSVSARITKVSPGPSRRELGFETKDFA